MPVALPLLVPFLVLLAATAALALHQTENLWLRPLLEGLSHPHGSFFKKLAFRAAGLIVAGVLYIEKHVRAALSHFAAGSLPVLVRWLNAQAHLWAGMAYEVAHVAEDAALSLAHLRHVTMPRAIKARVAPVAAVAAGAAVLGRRAISEGKTLRIRTGRSIDRLNRKTGLLAGILLGIDVLVKGRHAHTHHHAHTHDLPQIRDRDIPRIKTREKAIEQRLARHGTRLSRLEKLLGAGVFVGLLVKTIARRWPWLFCRNWKKVGNRVCGMHTGLLDFLLGLGGAMFVFSELCRFIESVAALAARVLPRFISVLAVAGAALCDGRHSAPPPLPLQTTSLPPVDHPLALTGH